MSLNDSTLSETQQPVIVINNHLYQAPSGQPVVDNQPSKSEIDKWAHRIKITSWTMIAIGAFSALNMVFCSLNARSISGKIFKGGMHTDWNGKDPLPEQNGDEPLSRDEFALYDVFKGFAFYGILLGVSLACAGCKSLMATKANSPAFTHRAIRCTACKVFFLVVFTVLMHGKGKEMKAILQRHQPAQPFGRELAETKVANLTAGCSGLAQASCNSNDQCTWCRSMAVKSQCYTLTDAQSLPGGVFECDKLSADEDADDQT